MIYFIIPIILSIIGANISKRKQSQKIFVIFAFIILWLLIGLRSDAVGNDTQEYGRIYESLKNNEMFFLPNPRFEYGYVLLCRFLGLLNISVRGMYLVMAALAILPVAVITCRRSYKPWLSILLFCFTSFYLDMFSAMRVVIAWSFGLMAIDSVVRKKPISYLFWVIMATLFHNTGIFMILLYPLSFFRINKNFMGALLMVSIVALILMPIISKLVVLVFPQYSYYFAESLNGRFYPSVLLNFTIAAFLFCMYMCFRTPYLNNILDNTKLYKRRYNIAVQKKTDDVAFSASELREGKIYLLTILIALCVATVEFRFPLLDRIVVMYNYSVFISVPFFAHYIKDKNKRNIFIWVIVIVCAGKTIGTLILRPEWSNILPYKFFWS